MRTLRTCIVLLMCILIAVPNIGYAADSTNSDITVATPTIQSDNDREDLPATSRPLNLKDLRKKYPETFKFQGPHVHQVALTFDDVPDPRFTPKVLDQLKRQGVKATFFVVGHRAKKHPELLRRIHEEGHVIGNHSYSHPQFKRRTVKQFQTEIKKTEKIIEQIVGYKPKLIRPPYGEINEAQLKWAQRNGYRVVNWNVDSLDWKGLNKEQVKKNIMKGINPGAIILQHAGGGSSSTLDGTIQAIPEIVQAIRKRGYRFVTLPELLRTKKAITKKTAS